MNRNKNKITDGFIQHHFSQLLKYNPEKELSMNNKSTSDFAQKNSAGFTLIELLVVVAIIALLTSVALISLMSARQKSRDTKRVADMIQSNTALELYWSTFKGYPSTAGVPTDLVPKFAATLPTPPMPADGGCDQLNYPVAGNPQAVGYYYYPSGTVYVGSNNTQVVPDFAYYFCVGHQTGEVTPGIHMVTPKGLR